MTDLRQQAQQYLPPYTSKQLGDKLFQLTGWNAHHNWSVDIFGNDRIICTSAAGTTVPAYTSDEIASKLPQQIDDEYLLIRHGSMDWSAGYGTHHQRAQSLADCLCRLAIMLAESGLLPKQENK